MESMKAQKENITTNKKAKISAIFFPPIELSQTSYLSAFDELCLEMSQCV